MVPGEGLTSPGPRLPQARHSANKSASMPDKRPVDRPQPPTRCVGSDRSRSGGIARRRRTAISICSIGSSSNSETCGSISLLCVFSCRRWNETVGHKRNDPVSAALAFEVGPTEFPPWRFSVWSSLAQACGSNLLRGSYLDRYAIRSSLNSWRPSTIESLYGELMRKTVAIKIAPKTRVLPP